MPKSMFCIFKLQFQTFCIKFSGESVLLCKKIISVAIGTGIVARFSYFSRPKNCLFFEKIANFLQKIFLCGFQCQIWFPEPLFSYFERKKNFFKQKLCEKYGFNVNTPGNSRFFKISKTWRDGEKRSSDS